MTIQASGLVSGMDTNSIITQLMALERRPIDLMKQRKTTLNSQLTQVNALKTRANTLLASLKKLATTSVLDKDLFKATKGTSSDETIASATTTEKAAQQTISLEVKHLATSTRAMSTTPIGQPITAATAVNTISQGTITSGTFTVFVNGVANQVTVNKDTNTVDDVLSQIRGFANVADARVTNGRLEIEASAGATIKLGANADTSNFLDATFLKTGTLNSNTITGSVALNSINLDGALQDNTAARLQTAVTAGSQFKIGNHTFTIDGTTTLRSLIASINNASDAGVSASYNVAENKLQLTANSTGSGLITLQDVSGNFLESMGLIVAGDSTASQTSGLNAEFVVNGSTLFSSSNTVTDSISGITGVSLELKKAAIGTTINIDVNQDVEPLTTAIEDIVKQFNTLLSSIDDQTKAEGGILKGSSSLKRFRAQLRQTITDAVGGLTKYTAPQLAGVSTGAVNPNGTATSSTILFDKDKFKAALADNAEEVRTLFVGTSGAFTKLRNIVDKSVYDGTTDTDDGLFVSFNTATNNTIKEIDESISRMEDRLVSKEARMRAQFRAMEQLMAQFQSQSTAITNLNNQFAANNRR